MTKSPVKWFLVLVAALVGAGLWYHGYVLTRDIDSWIERAQLSGDRTDMAIYLGAAMSGMIDHYADTGHTALVFKTPANDLGLLYRSMEQLSERLMKIADEPESSIAYQVALDDIRDTVGELPNPTAGILWVQHWQAILLMFACGFAGLMWIVWWWWEEL